MVLRRRFTRVNRGVKKRERRRASCKVTLYRGLFFE